MQFPHSLQLAYHTLFSNRSMFTLKIHSYILSALLVDVVKASRITFERPRPVVIGKTSYPVILTVRIL